MNYSKTDFLKDFATRAKANLDKIDECVSNGEQLFEVTQLVNSFIGLLIIPQQIGDELIEDRYVNEQTLNSLKQGVLLNSYTNNRKDVNLKNIIYHMRNAIAHGKLTFQSNENLNGDKEIHTIEFKDKLNVQEFINEFIDNFLE